MRSFVPYLKSLVHRPFRRATEAGTELGRTLQVLGEIYDGVRDVAYAVRRAWYVRTCPDEALPLHGDERRLWQQPGESLEAYRARLERAWETWQSAGTDAGVELALALAGLADADVHALGGTMRWHPGDAVRIGDGVPVSGWRRWAFLEVVAPLPAGATFQDVDRWLATLRRWKSAHARLWPDGGLHLVADEALQADDWPEVDDDLSVGQAHELQDAWVPGGGGWRIGDPVVIGDGLQVGAVEDTLVIDIVEVA